MARFHASALARNSANLLAKISLLLASPALVASCATTPAYSLHNNEVRFRDPGLIYLETGQFLWADAWEREQLACANGTPVICTGGQSRLSFSHCGCLPDDD